jgi:hypothetical protein
MSPLRFNHMELTLPPGGLTESGDDIRRFYSEVFGFTAIDVPIMEQTGLLLATDDEVSQFILLTEMEEHMRSPGYDHLGFHMDSREEVDRLRETCSQWQAKDSRVKIKDYDDLVIGDTTVRAFYVRFLLPIWFDVQTIEQAPGTGPEKRWRYS